MQIVHDYRQLHAIPELDRVLPKTLQYIESRLQGLSCRVFAPSEGALCAFLDFGQPKTLAFRADMDALPIAEQTGLPWSSQHPGRMHACGHDGHCAMVLELARQIHRQRQLPHNILLIFQPAEETDGGAEDICRTGLLERYQVTAIFGLHLWPGLPKGQLFSRSGVLMGHSCGAQVIFTGKSVHVAQWKKGRDALGAACAFYGACGRLTGQDHLVKFGVMNAGTAGNVVCDRAVLSGSVRAAGQGKHRRLKKKMVGIARRKARRWGCEAQVRFTEGYPAVENHPALLRQVRRQLPVGRVPKSLMTAEDFSRYQQKVPGVYFLLGIGNTPPLHSSDFQFDEEVLTVGADFLFSLATLSI